MFKKTSNTKIIILTLCVISLNFIGYYILLGDEKVTPILDWLFICILFIINFLLIYFAYIKNMIQINKIISQSANIIIFSAASLIVFNFNYLKSCIIPFDKSFNNLLSYLNLLFENINNIYFNNKLL